MKRLSCITLLGASMLMFSCGDDAPSADNGALPDKFSSKTVEENKAQLEDNGIKLLQSLDGMKDSKAIETAGSLMSLMNGDDEWEEAAPGGRILSSVARVKDAKSANKVFSAMRLQSDDSFSLQDSFDEAAGSYKWNASTEEWDTVSMGGSTIEFKFPAVEGGTSNNAVLTIGNLATVPVTFDGEATDLPTKLSVALSADGTKVMDYSFTASYNNAGDPVSLSTSLSMDSYVFKVDFSNSTSEIKVDYSLKNGAEILIAAGASTTGKYSLDSFEENEDGSEPDPEDIIDAASAYFQVYNIKIAGDVNAKKIAEGLEAIDNGPLSGEAEVEAEVKLLNENYNLIVFYADSKEKIADTEFYTTESTYTDYEGVDNDGDGYPDSWEPVQRTETNADVRFIFADDSRSDFETYFNTGFGEFEAEMEAFMEALED